MWRWVLASSISSIIDAVCRMPDVNVFERLAIRLIEILVRFQFASTLGRDIGQASQVNLPGYLDTSKHREHPSWLA